MADETSLEAKLDTLYYFLGVDRDASFQEIYVACTKKKEEIAETRVPHLGDKKRLKSAERILRHSTRRLLYDIDLLEIEMSYQSELAEIRIREINEKYDPVIKRALEAAKDEEERRNRRYTEQFTEQLLEIERNSEKQQKWYVVREIATFSVAGLLALGGGYVGFEFGPEDISSSVDTLEGTVKGGVVGLSLLVLRAIGENVYEKYCERKARARIEQYQERIKEVMRGTK